MKRIWSIVGALLMVAAFSNATVYAVPQHLPGGMVVLGDSYASGDPVDTVSVSPCLRQDYNIGQEIMKQLPGRYSYMRNVSCAGAKVNEVLTGRLGEPPQIDAIRRDTRLVVISIGGNDGLGPASFAACVLPLECREDNPLVQRGTAGINGLWNSKTRAGSLVNLFAKIHQRIAPGTKVLVNGYPVRISPTIERNEFPGCRELVSVGERRLINDKVRQLNDAVRGAAEQAGFTFVDVLEAVGLEEGICSNNPSKPIAALEDPVPLHPTKLGIQRIAGSDARTAA